jgi:hypothetical protein
MINRWPLIIFSCLIAWLGVFSVEQALAVGVGVKPKDLNLKIQAAQQTVTEILVMNVSNEPAIYQVYPDGLEKNIKIGPTDFRLEPGDSQIVKIIVKINNPGRFSTNISVIGRPLANAGLAAASGVKVPIMVEVFGLNIYWFLLAALVCLAVFFTLLLRNKQPKKSS